MRDIIAPTPEAPASEAPAPAAELSQGALTLSQGMPAPGSAAAGSAPGSPLPTLVRWEEPGVPQPAPAPRVAVQQSSPISTELPECFQIPGVPAHTEPGESPLVTEDWSSSPAAPAPDALAVVPDGPRPPTRPETARPASKEHETRSPRAPHSPRPASESKQRRRLEAAIVLRREYIKPAPPSQRRAKARVPARVKIPRARALAQHEADVALVKGLL